MKKYIVSVFIGASLMAPVFAFADHTIPHSIEQIQAQIVVLQTQLNTLLQQQLSQAPVAPTTIGGDVVYGGTAIKTNLGFGYQGTAVIILQNMLKDAGIYSGPVTGYFGVLTREAVKNLQLSHGIPGTGFVGPLTRNFLSTVTVISPTHQVCTQEAKQCLDGSYVSRTGPNCEFAACLTIPSESFLKVVSPSGGEQWQKGTTQKIQWTAPSSVSSVSISLEQWFACLYTTPRCAIAQRLYTLASSVQNNGMFQWTVGKDAAGNDIPDGQYIVGISAADGSAADSSDAPFGIVAPGTVTFSASPTAGGAPLAVMFYSNTQSGIVDFGDGAPSTQMECDNVSATNFSSVSSTCLRTFTKHTYTAPGTYTAKLTKTIYNDCQATGTTSCAAWYSREETIGTVIIKVTSDGTAQPMTILSPNGGEQWKKETTQNIKWSAPSSVSSVSISLEAWYACLYTSPRCAIAQRLYTLVASTQNDSVFEWVVGKDASGSDIPAGQYMVTVSGGAFSDVSDKPFSIVAPGTIVAPTISSLQPTSGPVDMNITITGTGFTAINNSVKFGGGYLNGISSNGTAITFTVPDGLNTCPPYATLCPGAYMQVTPGTYSVSVINANGASNAVNFTVTSKTGTLSINPTSAIIKVGGTTEFQALFDNCPSGAQCFVGPLPVRAVWTSSPKVASVAYKEIPCPAGSSCFVQQFDYLTAVVTGIALGSATITAAYTDSSGAVFTASAIVTTVMP